jgi:hypothetical protein
MTSRLRPPSKAPRDATFSRVIQLYPRRSVDVTVGTFSRGVPTVTVQGKGPKGAFSTLRADEFLGVAAFLSRVLDGEVEPDA